MEKKDNLSDVVNSSTALIYVFGGIFLLGIAKKISDFLIAAAIEKYDKRIEAAVKNHFEPLEKKLADVEKTLHHVVSKKNISNVRADLLLDKLEEILDSKNEKE